jgi:ribosomal protein S21
MAVNVEISKKKNENNMSLLKKFGRRVQESGILQHSRKIRYASRSESDYVKKKNKLHSLRKKEEIEELVKLGKIAPRGRGRGRR